VGHDDIGYEVLAFVVLYRAFLARCADTRYRVAKATYAKIDDVISNSLPAACEATQRAASRDKWPDMWRYLMNRLQSAAGPRQAAVARCAEGVERGAQRLLPHPETYLTPQLAKDKLLAVMLGDIRRPGMAAREFWGPAKQVRAPFEMPLCVCVCDESPPKHSIAGLGIKIEHNRNNAEVELTWNRWSSFVSQRPRRRARDYVRLRAGVWHEIMAHVARKKDSTNAPDGWLAYMALRREFDFWTKLGLPDEKLRDDLKKLLEEKWTDKPPRQRPSEFRNADCEYARGWRAACDWYAAFENVAQYEHLDGVCVFDGAASANPYGLLHLFTKIGLGAAVCRSRLVPCTRSDNGQRCALVTSALSCLRDRVVTPEQYDTLVAAACEIGFSRKQIEIHAHP
jgi:hypothetical protein